MNLKNQDKETRNSSDFLHDLLLYLNSKEHEESSIKIEEVICERLQSELYTGAWMVRKTSEDRVKYIAGSLTPEQVEEFESTDSSICNHYGDREPKKIDENHLTESFSDLNLFAIPVGYNNIVYRTLIVQTDKEELEESEASMLRNISNIIGLLLKNRKLENLIYSKKKIELTIDLITSKIPISRLEKNTSLELKVEKFTPLKGNTNEYLLEIKDTEEDVEEVLNNIEIIETYEILEDKLLRIKKQNDRLGSIMDAGCTIDNMEIDRDKLRLEIGIPADAEKQVLFEVLDAISEEWHVRKKEFKSSENLVNKERDRWSLTEKQLTALKSAYASGYYDNPRKTNAKELASELGISDSTLFQHLQAAHKKMIREFLGSEVEGKKLSENSLRE